MGFFDLNIPYDESSRHATSSNRPTTQKAIRLKLVIKAMELGYTGIAYNRTIKGVMSESDRCTVPTFPVSSILKNLSSFSSFKSSISLHRRVLNVPISAPFRQYTRLTVVVESPAQAAALNSGNPILKSYDIVAVKPMNQTAFEHACQTSEVDIIAIDFSEKLPFRLKQQMVKAAIERGVYFEITYSSLLMDVQVKRQVIPNVKLLVDWTRGKNLILSSAAPTVTELRGPYDVANLTYLLGMSMERAKAAISKNCRSLLANALRKKNCYKEVIKVEAMPSIDQMSSGKTAFDNWLKWDPISSDEGDLLLDDIEKAFSAAVNETKVPKPIDLLAVAGSLGSHFQINDMTSAKNAEVEPPAVCETLPAAEESEVVSFDRIPATASHLASLHASETSKLMNSNMSPSGSSALIESNCAKETGTGYVAVNELKSSADLGVNLMPTEIDLHGSQLQILSDSRFVTLEDNSEIQTTRELTEVAPIVDAPVVTVISTSSNNVPRSPFHSKESKMSSSSDADLCMHNVNDESRAQEDSPTKPYDESLNENFLDGDCLRLREDDSVVPSGASGLDYNSQMNMKVYRLPFKTAVEEPRQVEAPMSTSFIMGESPSGRSRMRQRTYHRAKLFPFKRLLNSVPFKRKARKIRNQS